jgi:hypothetical protein
MLARTEVEHHLPSRPPEHHSIRSKAAPRAVAGFPKPRFLYLTVRLYATISEIETVFDVIEHLSVCQLSMGYSSVLQNSGTLKIPKTKIGQAAFGVRGSARIWNVGG